MISKKGWDPRKDAISVEDQINEIIGGQNFVVECMVCKKLHNPNKETFFTICGNALVGIKGGIIGNNFSKNGKLARIMFICRNESCVNNAFPIEEQNHV
jgi:hypothetical protein